MSGSSWKKHPGLHIYHYAHYEASALKRLMGRYATREDELDRMLRAERFVDLYAVVRQGLRASVERTQSRSSRCSTDSRGMLIFPRRRPAAALSRRRSLVVTDPRCNDKRDSLRRAEHLEHWRVSRSGGAASQLVDIAKSANWETRPGRTLAAMRSIYLHMSAEQKVWLHGRDF